MKSGILSTFFGLILFPVCALAQGGENMEPKCQKLAHEFAENPESLNEMQLRQLQFCVTHTIDQRYKTDPPDLLRGTIIEPPVSTENPDIKPPTP
ncbi:hypothetical protein [Candidatus Nitrospira allomarina]|jgi:hypothetical protein|uniref:Uncharacterized protein n=1 Tax=Candidatus Nitrospira allomarina TaxID=3020900 RepID=A0AA96JQV8_9BACT|nr:hypothetical protein [Candidatus Nitrospira allomarina]WNM56428.1 hypothetical protein PP769_10575 [Candidatus Nitrospira allomarina]